MDKEIMVDMYNGILFSHEMNEVRPFAATRKDLDTLTKCHKSYNDK